tara:strand:- start:1133 stop:1405 length:273 start_codon:yes stop_codon:yes gene_type:complete
VKVALAQVTLPKSTIAVVPVDFGKVAVTVKFFPPAVYADPDVFVISFDVLYAVVSAPKEAALEYKAILKVAVSKSCSAFKSSTLKEVHVV